MQIIKSVRTLILLLLPFAAISQSSYIPFGSKDYNFIDRLEIKSGDPNLMFSTIKPLNRRLFTRAVQNLDSLISNDSARTNILTKIDRYNRERFLMNNLEWVDSTTSFASKKPIGKHFFKTPANLYEVNQKDFFLAVNPVVQYKQSFESGNSQNLFLNSRGFSIRGLIGEKVGFDIYVTDNQERDPAYVQSYITSHTSVPGARFYKNFKGQGGVDYFDARGSVSFNASKYIDIQLGYDRNFIGDGHRSLFISDFSANNLFLKFNTRIWKLNYTNLFMELLPQGKRVGGDKVLPRKYFRMNYLSFNATKWLNIGVFDAVMFGRKDHFDFQYLIPVMFLRPAESDIGSGDNAIVGLNVKANIKKKAQVYGQLVLDEFLLKEVFKSNGYWANKFGYQLGVKYPDAFGLSNLDLQFETNRVRPFTYSHFDSVSDYSHTNLPLAHPLGANFQEYVAIAKYQPLNKLFLTGKIIAYYQGLDTAGTNYGSNINKNYNTRPKNFGFNVGSGDRATCLNLYLLASYELFENLFIDADFQYRKYKQESIGTSNSTIVSLGVRWNVGRRVFEF